MLSLRLTPAIQERRQIANDGSGAGVLFMNRTKAIDRLKDSHVLALSRYIQQRGRNWKKDLLVAWEGGTERAPNYTPELQQIRNVHGPQLIRKLRTSEILNAGAEVAAVRDARGVDDPALGR